ncbi:MAG: tRNA 4-thiouridine(8) synthase ThiI [Candidatus Pacearchaeota archaeon]
MPKKRCLALLSGGLDSRLAIKLMQQQGIDIIALYFSLPFGTGCCMPDCAFNFAQTQGIKLKIIDCTKGKLFQEYMALIRKPKYGYGSAINPCIDCRIFMLKKAKALMSKLKAQFIVTGEVLNERPMSQTRKMLDVVEKESGLQGKLLRPLSAKLLPETEIEKQGLVDRNKLLDIQGRSRKKQIELAKKFEISFPTPAGGCLLCEKEFAKRLRDLFEHRKKIEPRDIELLKLGRHFRYGKNKIIVGRNEQENKKLEALAKKDFIFELKDFPGPVTLMQGRGTKKAIEITAALTASYSDAPEGKRVIVNYRKGKLNKLLEVSQLNKKEIESMRLK